METSNKLIEYSLQDKFLEQYYINKKTYFYAKYKYPTYFISICIKCLDSLLLKFNSTGLITTIHVEGSCGNKTRVNINRSDAKIKTATKLKYFTYIKRAQIYLLSQFFKDIDTSILNTK
jgi:hypothetical protein